LTHFSPTRHGSIHGEHILLVALSYHFRVAPDWVSYIYSISEVPFHREESPQNHHKCALHSKHTVRHVTPFRCGGVSCVHRWHFRCSCHSQSPNLTIGPFAPNIQSIGMVRNHVAIRIPSRVNRERAATEQVHSAIHCSISDQQWCIWLVLLVVPLHSVIPATNLLLDDEIGTARLAQSVSFGINSSCPAAWGDFSSHVHALAVCLLGNQSG
jgi:hypothetical protein